MAKILNTESVAALRAKGGTLSKALDGGGSLIARGLSGKVRFYLQYRLNGIQVRYPFGDFARDGDSNGDEQSRRFNLDGAKRRAGALYSLHLEVGDLVAHMAEQQIEAAKQRELAKVRREQEEQAKLDWSLARLLEGYCDYLDEQGKVSATQVRGILNNWAINEHPAVCSTRASEVTKQDVMQILNGISKAGHKQQTNRVRAAMSAAYELAKAAEGNAALSGRFEGFGVELNPVEKTQRVKQFERAGQRALVWAELRLFMAALVEKDNKARRVVELSLRLGGQRITQLLRVGVSDIDIERKTLTIRDGKGAREDERLHELPLDDAAMAIVNEAMACYVEEGLLFGRLTQANTSTWIGKLAKKVAAENGLEPFVWRDLRRTCETRMAGLGIAPHIRAQIQSHGLSGIQQKHYDKYDYLPEKRAALNHWTEQLDALVAGEEIVSAKVVNIFR